MDWQRCPGGIEDVWAMTVSNSDEGNGDSGCKEMGHGIWSEMLAKELIRLDMLVAVETIVTAMATMVYICS